MSEQLTRVEAAWQKERAGMKLRDTTPRNWIDRGEVKACSDAFKRSKPRERAGRRQGVS